MKKILALIMAMLLALSCMGVMAEETAAEGEWWHVLLLGGDARNMNKYDRTDTMMILSINTETSQAKMTSIMRDTWVKIEGHGNGKINAANMYGGPELAVKTVNANFGTEIEDYILITMADMAEIVDLLGGVEVDVTAAEQKVANKYIKHAKAKFINERDDYFDYSLIEETGLVHLDGVQAMAYCRDRYNNSDFDRVMRQQEVMLAMAGKAQNLEIDECIAVADQIGDFVSTNLTDEEIQTLAKAAMVVEPAEVEQHRIPAEGDYESGTFSGTWMIRPNLAKCKATVEKILSDAE